MSAVDLKEGPTVWFCVEHGATAMGPAPTMCWPWGIAAMSFSARDCDIRVVVIVERKDER